MAKAKRKKGKKAETGFARNVLKGCLISFTVLLFLLAVTGAVATWFLVRTVRDFTEDLNLAELMIPAARETTKIFAEDGGLLAELFVENREIATLDEIPDIFQLAVISTEDAEFYTHKGLNFKRLAAAVASNLQSRSKGQGGSTITQQLARYLFLSPEKTMPRKIKEMILAIWLEDHYTKDEILEQYLNRIYFGHGAYGVKAAAKVFFNKSMNDLTLSEAALLAGLPQTPTRHSPFNHPDSAVRRRNWVLKRMVSTYHITDAQYRQAMMDPLRTRSRVSADPKQTYRFPYFVTYIIALLQEEDVKFDVKFSSEELYGNGLRIYTTLNPSMQRAAEKAVKEGIAAAGKAYKGIQINQGALVAIDPSTGDIRSMVGGVDFERNEFNRAWQAQRQPGSAFKPFVYLTGLRLGYSMENPVMDSRVCYPIAGQPSYCPKNYDNKFRGRITFRSALIGSRNVPTVKLAHAVGIEEVIATAREMGIQSPLSPYLSLALGACEVTPLELIAAYAPLANGGLAVKPSAIVRIYDSSGAQRYYRKPIHGKKVVGDYALSQIIPTLKAVIEKGTGTRAKLDRPALGKTGTTSNHMDAWFVGLTPDLAAAVWVGNDRDKAMGSAVQGGRVPAPIWKNFMESALKDIPPRDFQIPEGAERPSRVYEEKGLFSEKKEDAVVDDPLERGALGEDPGAGIDVAPAFPEDERSVGLESEYGEGGAPSEGPDSTEEAPERSLD